MEKTGKTGEPKSWTRRRGDAEKIEILAVPLFAAAQGSDRETRRDTETAC